MKEIIAYDIDGNELRAGDYVVSTEERLKKFSGSPETHPVGELFHIEEIYYYPAHHAPIKDGGAEIVGTLRSRAAYTWNSDLKLYRKVDKP